MGGSELTTPAQAMVMMLAEAISPETTRTQGVGKKAVVILKVCFIGMESLAVNPSTINQKT
jgi:hypothetical protein